MPERDRERERERERERIMTLLMLIMYIISHKFLGRHYAVWYSFMSAYSTTKTPSTTP
jgi:hypothetical protein